MDHRIPLITMFSILIMITAVMPLSYEYEWSPEMMLTWNSENDANPSIVQARDGRIWVAWHSYRMGNADLFYKVYDSSHAQPWSSEKNLTTDSNADEAPSIMQALDGRIWVVWSTNRTGNYEIYYKTTSDNGATWSQPQNLTRNSKEDEYPSIMQAENGTIWLAWSANRTGNYEIYYKTSGDNGATWSTDMLLNYPLSDDRDPSITQAVDGKIWFVWEKNDLGTDYFNIRYKTYNATSNQWSATTAVTQDTGGILNRHPSIMLAQDGKIWIAWDSDKLPQVGKQLDVYYRIYHPDGRTFVPITTLTYSQEDDILPSIMQASDGTVWTIWATMRINNWDLYYMTTYTPQLHDVAIFSVIPTEVTVSEGQTVFTEVVAQNHGSIYENFTVRLYANLILVNESVIGLSPGLLWARNFTWVASNTGTYKIWAKASVVYGEIYTVDNTLPAIVGDVNYDRTVNASDLFVFKQAYGSTLGDANWNPDCNLDGFKGNNRVDVFDLFDLGKNYGRS